MNTNFRKTLIAGAIAALTTGTAWAADPPRYGNEAPAKSGIEQPARNDTNMNRALQPDGQSMGMHTQRSDREIYTRSADSLDGAEVVDRDGKKIGKVKQVVLAADRKSAHAVIAEGGLLGIGGREVRVSLDELTPLDDDKLQWRVTKEQVETMEEHTPGQFVEIEGDTPISGEITEFSAFDPMSEGDQSQAVPPLPRSSTAEESTDLSTSEPLNEREQLQAVPPLPDSSTAEEAAEFSAFESTKEGDRMPSVSPEPATDDEVIAPTTPK
jgi:sporulation protein YlmC with PRC-barrel domain